jgi:hypothetical protein
VVHPVGVGVAEGLLQGGVQDSVGTLDRQRRSRLFQW